MRYASTNLDLSLINLTLEIKSTLERCSINITELRERLSVFERGPQSLGTSDLLHTIHLRLLGMALLTGIIFSCMYHVLLCRPLSSDSDAAQWSREILELAHIAAKYRPLGAMAMIVCLDLAWVGAADDDVRREIKILLAEYHRECMGQISETEFTEGLEFTARRFLLRDVACNQQSSR